MTARSLENGVSPIQMFLVRSSVPSLDEIESTSSKGAAEILLQTDAGGKGG
jgi:hypothetical protein